MNKTRRVLMQLERRPRTVKQLRDATGVSNVPDAIYKLRRRGHDIHAEPITVRDRYGDQCRCVRYSLLQKEGT